MGGAGPENLPPSSLAAGQGQGMSVSTPNLPAGLGEINGNGPDPAMVNGLPKVHMLCAFCSFAFTSFRRIT